MHEYARVRTSTPEYARVRPSMPEYARVRTSTPEYARVRPSTHEYARVRPSTHEYARVRTITHEYARVCFKACAYIVGNPSCESRVCKMRGGGGGSPTPALFLAAQACFNAYAYIFGNPSCEYRVCKWGGSPPPTPPFFLSQASLLQSMCHMHTLKCCKSIMPESCLQIWGPRPPPPPHPPNLPALFIHFENPSCENRVLPIGGGGGGGCAPSPYVSFDFKPLFLLFGKLFLFLLVVQPLVSCVLHRQTLFPRLLWITSISFHF